MVILSSFILLGSDSNFVFPIAFGTKMSMNQFCLVISLLKALLKIAECTPLLLLICLFCHVTFPWRALAPSRGTMTTLWKALLKPITLVSSKYHLLSFYIGCVKLSFLTSWIGFIQFCVTEYELRPFVKCHQVIFATLWHYVNKTEFKFVLSLRCCRCHGSVETPLC